MRDIYWELVVTNFKLRYKGSVLGFVWVLIKPFSIFLLLFIVFSQLNQAMSSMSSREYGVFLLIGIVFFTLFHEGIIWGMGSLLDKSNIILKVNFPRPIAVVSSISLALINFGINALIIIVLCVFVGVDANLVSVSYLVLVVLTAILIIWAVSLFAAIWLVRLRDLKHIAELGMQLIFYGSAIFYPIDIIPERWQPFILYNPVAALVQAARHAIIYGEIARAKYVVALFAASIILLFLGTAFFNKQVKKIAEYF